MNIWMKQLISTVIMGGLIYYGLVMNTTFLTILLWCWYIGVIGILICGIFSVKYMITLQSKDLYKRHTCQAKMGIDKLTIPIRVFTLIYKILLVGIFIYLGSYPFTVMSGLVLALSERFTYYSLKLKDRFELLNERN